MGTLTISLLDKNGLTNGKLVRFTGSTETVKEFMVKPKSKEIAFLLKKGKSVRDIAGRSGISHYLVCKMRKHVIATLVY